MLNQSFDEESLLKLTRKKEIIKFSLGREKKDYKESLKNISDEISGPGFYFSELSYFEKDNKKVFFTNNACEYYAIKKITDNLKRLYRIKFSSRDDISEQALRIFEDTSSYRVFRIDIKSFFESVDILKLKNKLELDSLLSYEGKKLLDKLISSFPEGFSGLPRGLSISSVLSELFMEDIDNKIKSMSEVYYYARYVDDIIIITHDDYMSFEKDIVPIFKYHKLSVNEKTQELKISSCNKDNKGEPGKLSLLGYDYTLYHNCDDLGKRAVKVEISKNKINKIKTRVIKSIFNYDKVNPKSLRDEVFIKRIAFLSGNYELYSDIKNKKTYHDDMGTLKGGIYYGNRLVNNSLHLKELNVFLRNSLFCDRNSSFGNAVKKIPMNVRRQAVSNCFMTGFEQRIFHEFSEEEFNLISSCWN
ncbi:antiviral reverse transcriptase Drt3a [Photobacterium rosenbergii]|uniref:Antiviral reverse transcriptase Drt3a n=1 Tax=Photobacterium rosenbergii TaxID=294936 RepID=A0ABU3ZLS6_9GAMM|nr:antiviral reverse transcriptase Drt3a [Photobacterium rosenbergii]MDV5171049.1 antiviral reverse transcriptase Drt3a [Photobacterium rosenbergii]